MTYDIGQEVRKRGTTIWGLIADHDAREYLVAYPAGGSAWLPLGALTDDVLVDEDNERQAEHQAHEHTAGAALVTGARGEAYGPPEKSFRRIAGLWSAYLGHEVTTHDVAALMILLKVSREKSNHHEDNLTDIEGYVYCARILTRENA
jgi:hypothetical protein